MFYFKVDNEVALKYQVNYNGKEIEKLREDIIHNCSIIIHREYYNHYPPHFTDKSLVFNYKSMFAFEKEYFEETKDIYLYTFDEYKPPYLIKLVDRLLKEDVSVIDEILNYKGEDKVSFDEEINLVNKEYLNADNIFERQQRIKELENLLNQKNLNKNQQGTYIYYQKLLSLIKFELIDTLSLDYIQRVEDFYTKDTKVLSKALKRN